jgi:hypothetical protein
MSKGMVIKWEKLAYSSTCCTANGTSVGGVVDRECLIVAHCKRSVRRGFTWPELPSEVERPMANCLRPVGVPWAAYRQVTPTSADALPDACFNCMPAQPGALIRMDRGVRRLLHDELATGLGLPKSWRKEYPTGHLVRKTVPLHLFEYLTPLLLQPQSPSGPSKLPEVVATDDMSPISECELVGDYVVFQWRPPDLRVGSRWNAIRVANLRLACDTYPNSDELFEKGLRMLDCHRNNYNEEGPNLTQVQLLWWEFPSEHWDALREGSPMNFLRGPAHLVQPNLDMTEEQMAIAVRFFDELVDLGIFKELLEGEEMLTNAPLFCLPKACQPGEWQILADMRKGRQNEAIGADPTIFPKASMILDQMYCNVWSAVVDASKFFHQFTVRKEDQKFLGILHPHTGRVYVYGSLPMSSASSLSLANRYGSSVLRKLRDISTLFQGKPICKTWWQAFLGQRPFDPHLGHGMVLMSVDWLPAGLIWAHCDDFLIHGPTRRKCTQALTAFMDYLVEVGLLCHPGKLTPPSQIVKYTGFLFDSRGMPTLRVPDYKVNKSVAMINYSVSHRSHFSRLGLAVVKGALESQSEATPSRSGHTHLRSLEETLRPSNWDEDYLAYYSFTSLTDQNVKDLLWYPTTLIRNKGRQSRADNAGVLVPSFGDGLGTGTGGSVWYRMECPLERWKANWSASVYHRSSNWKEMRTLDLTLERAQRFNPEAVANTTFFYFADNLVSYFAVTAGASKSPRLQAMVESARLDSLASAPFAQLHRKHATLVRGDAFESV